MSNELQDVLIWVANVIGLIAVIGMLIFGVIAVRAYRRAGRAERGLTQINSARLEGEAIIVAARRERQRQPIRPHLRLLPAWFGLAALGGWISRHKATTLTLVGVAMVSPAIVLLPQDAQMGPQAAPPPITTTRTTPHRAAPQAPTAPPATPETPAAPTTSTPPPLTTVAPTTAAAPTTSAASTSARPVATPPPTAPLSTTSPAPATSPPTIVQTPTTTATVAEAPPRADGGKPDKDKGKKKATSAAVSVAAASSLPSTPCLRLIIDLCLLGGDRGQL